MLDSTGNLSDFSEAVSAKVADDISAPEVVSINPVSGSIIGPAYIKPISIEAIFTFEYIWMFSVKVLLFIFDNIISHVITSNLLYPK